VDQARAACTRSPQPPFDRAILLAATVRGALNGTLERAAELCSAIPPAAASELARSLGPALVRFLVASQAPGPVVLRANRRRASREALQMRLKQQHRATRLATLAPDGLLLDGHRPLGSLAAWREGWFEVQDEGSQLIAELVPHGPVLDLCAGAGGKALQLAARGDAVTATDVRHHALNALVERADRAGLRIEVVRGDPTPCANVLVDAPCSGTGRLRREPGLRQRWTPEFLESRRSLQTDLLDRAASLVRPGGALVYATCSVLRSENQDQIARFVGRHPEFRLRPLREILGDVRAAQIGDGLCLNVAPHTHGTDGFFAARLDRCA
jgi:16S rRNA (cytosine967-C5)-methyltransferase